MSDRVKERKEDHYSCARWSHIWSSHYVRYRRYVEAMPRPLVCQDCRGSGGEVVPILDDGSGPFETCGWCEGTGLMTPWLRGQWLQYKREERRKQQARVAA